MGRWRGRFRRWGASEHSATTIRTPGASSWAGPSMPKTLCGNPPLVSPPFSAVLVIRHHCFPGAVTHLTSPQLSSGSVRVRRSGKMLITLSIQRYTANDDRYRSDPPSFQPLYKRYETQAALQEAEPQVSWSFRGQGEDQFSDIQATSPHTLQNASHIPQFAVETLPRPCHSSHRAWS